MAAARRNDTEIEISGDTIEISGLYNFQSLYLILSCEILQVFPKCLF